MRGSAHLTAIAALGMGAVALGIAGAADAMLGRPDTTGVAVIKDASGKQVGTLHVEDDDGATKVEVSVNGLPPGFHGFHIHSKGVCAPPSFESAGKHFDLGSNVHPNHSGDLPTLLVGTDGHGKATAVTGRFHADQLFDADGSAIVIHAQPDNFANIPERYAKRGPDAQTRKGGDSGRHIACGVITRH